MGTKCKIRNKHQAMSSTYLGQQNGQTVRGKGKQKAQSRHKREKCWEPHTEDKVQQRDALGSSKVRVVVIRLLYNILLKRRQRELGVQAVTPVVTTKLVEVIDRGHSA
ncbi:hypothetical protein AVEN_80924-1 [Araneus ventricosus]|uniref:Uncharacterized protein n=1 Tax=Araneus ventricosus TaxID=182803 RepID=A0A4Y2GQD5_ARAVE|nr:hypothetical protein AVEN_80924-1 [Araneus ventricosus]